MLRWSVAVFACNEERTIARCLDAIIAECAGEKAQLHVVVNGSSDRSLEIARDYADRHPAMIFAHRILHADKQNAWNQYIHELRVEAGTHIFVDAYAYVTPGSLRALEEGLKRPGVNAAAAIPGSGRSRERIVEDMRGGSGGRGLHGSLHALTGDFVNRIRARGIRQPVGIYRGDGLVGAMALYDLDPLRNRYDYARIALVDEASWTFDSLRPWRWRDLRRQLRRYLMQQRGRVENEAIKRVIRARGFEGLPAHVDTLLADYFAAGGRLSSNPAEAAIERYALRTVHREMPVPERLALVTQPQEPARMS
jgi:glycosyltransferase involved in cell wall biosynthesis